MKILTVLLAAHAVLVGSQVVRNINVMGHIPYMSNVVNEVARELERREWCNLKVPDVTIAVNETVIGDHYIGTVTYSNGFVVRIQHIDIQRTGVDQNWSWNVTDETATVLLTATMRMTDLTLGYDVLADLQAARHRYTVAVTVPSALFTFNLRKNVNTEHVQIDVTGRVNTAATVNTVKFLPTDSTTDVLMNLFDFSMPNEGIQGWGQEVIAPITLDVYYRLDFPKICYDCPL